VARATLASEFKALRESLGLEQQEVAFKCDFNPATVWKVEHGKSVRWESLHTMLTVAMYCQPGSSKYENIHRLWLQQRQERAEAAPARKGKHKVTAAEKLAIAHFRELLRGRPDEEIRKIMIAAAGRAKKLSVTSLGKSAPPSRRAGRGSAR
jgi:transcriptional regulator with XRE-family HTH domain